MSWPLWGGLRDRDLDDLCPPPEGRLGCPKLMGRTNGAPGHASQMCLWTNGRRAGCWGLQFPKGRLRDEFTCGVHLSEGLPWQREFGDQCSVHLPVDRRLASPPRCPSRAAHASDQAPGICGWLFPSRRVTGPGDTVRRLRTVSLSGGSCCFVIIYKLGPSKGRV